MLTTEEKIALVSGTDFMYTNPIPRLDIPSIRMSDGPHGLRIQQEKGDNGTSNSEIATCFPTAVTTSSSWNPDNAYKMGVCIGEEARHYGVNVVLGPGVNIKRNPLCGRNFEYFSEDPFLAGKMGCAEVNGIQSQGVGVSVKHFALNNSENFRFMGDSVADMRAIREIYLKPFEMIVENSSPETIMCAYNKINGVYCSQNEWLLSDVLRKEWGFNGLVMTDWGATHDRLEMLKAGLDLEMPGDTAICRKWISDGLISGKLPPSVLDDAVKNVLKLVEKHRNDKALPADFTAHHEIAKQIAIDSAVLLKNDGALPLDKQEEIFVCGELFEKMRYQGAGSSMINPALYSSPKTAFDNNGVCYKYAKGYLENQLETKEELITEALTLSADYEKVLVFAGLTDYVESEGIDRANMQLCPNQLELISALIKNGKKVIVILYGGSSIELPFADSVSAILNMFLPGQNGGNATYSLVFGEVSPSGKLAESWPLTYSDVPFSNEFSKTKTEVYKESVFVGYRYYLTANKKVRYPFGYGLSYTKFEYNNLILEDGKDSVLVSFNLTNVGNFDGAEVAEVYVKPPHNEVFGPLRELKGFEKVYLKKGETKALLIKINKEDLRYFNVKENKFVLESGKYSFMVCCDVETVKLKGELKILGDEKRAPLYDSEITKIYAHAKLEEVTNETFEKMAQVKIPKEPPVTPITLESPLSDMRKTKLGKVLHSAILSVAKNDMRKAKRLPDGIEKDNKIKGALLLERTLNTVSVNNASMTAGKSMPYNVAEGLVYLSNGKILKGIKRCVSKIKAPKLPKNTRR